MQFRDRADAGKRLSEALDRFEGHDAVVLGLPRGGVPVAFEVAERLGLPLDVVVVRKIGAPSNPEFGVGAVGEEGVVLLNRPTLGRLGLQEEDLRSSVEDEQAELERRLERYRRGRPAAEVKGRTALLVDDGVATGGSAKAAIEVLRERGAGKVVLAVPVGPPETIAELEQFADEVVCLEQPASFMAVGTWYRDFGQTRDEEVVALLERAHGRGDEGDD
ncbi:MAG: phosphoribosyltransferase [Nitriliruptorales bacterium]